MDFSVTRVSKTYYNLRRFSRRLWVRTTGIAALALAAAWSASAIEPLVPERVEDSIGDDALLRILEILASSMLAVTIFSLSIMVQARQSASTQVTPRSYRLLIEDTTTQTVLGTFLGAFVFAFASLIVVSTGFYDDGAAAVIMLFTLVVVALVVIALLRWIEHLSDLGSVVETTRRVEAAAKEALDTWRRYPSLGARPMKDPDAEIPGGAAPFVAPRTGYVQHVDLRQVSAAVGSDGGGVWVVAPPGEFVTAQTPIAWIEQPVDSDILARAFTIGASREFDQDPNFGVTVLAEIAERALSPGLNDPGTAIDIVSRLLMLLLSEDEIEEGKVFHTRVWMPPLNLEKLLRAGFSPIARDGAGTFEVGRRLQGALAALAASPIRELADAARAVSAEALVQSDRQLALERDREALRRIAPAAA